MKRYHYSGKVVQNSQLHLGVFLRGALLGAMQFGPSLDKRKMMGIVQGTGWNEFIELNRMAFSDALPRNSESRAISVAMRMIRTKAPHIKWVVSFADATQCGDGTIYRASGFVLTGIKRNTQVWSSPTTGGSAGAVVSRTTVTKGKHMVSGAASMNAYIEGGYTPLAGFQLRYIYFIDAASRSQLTVAELPFSRIAECGASMYLGNKAGPVKGSSVSTTDREGGSIPTTGLQSMSVETSGKKG